MDPNATLTGMREAITGIRTSPHAQEICEHADDLAELVQAMDEWLAKGGFLPADWQTTLGPEHWQQVLADVSKREYERGYTDAMSRAIEIVNHRLGSEDGETVTSH